MFTAKDIMTPKIKTLEPSGSIQEAIQFFNETKVTSVPVVQSNGEAMGMMTEMSLVRAVVLMQLQPDKFKKIQHISDLLEKAVFVNEVDQMPKVLAAMISSAVKRVIVQNNAGQFTGIISPKDLLKALNGDKSLAATIQAATQKGGAPAAQAAPAAAAPAADKKTA